LLLLARHPIPTWAQRNDMDSKREKIAILGGGLGGIATALFLTHPKNPNRHRYKVTVYQLGWRLGGKCASGRNFDRGKGGRIQEHGLHIMLGFYENTFRMIRETMAEWVLPANHPWRTPNEHDRWSKAFKPANFAPLVEPGADGNWDIWPLRFPHLPGTPGDGEAPRDDLIDFLLTIDLWLKAMLGMTDEEDSPDRCLKEWLASPAKDESARERVCKCRHHRKLSVIHALPILFGLLRVFVLGMKRRGMRGWRRRFERMDAQKKQSSAILYVFVDIASALFCGLLRNAVRIYRGTLDVLDDYEFRDFLKAYGASQTALESPLIDALYDAAFACRGGTGKREDENLAAGVAIRSFIGITLSYKGSPWWEMNAGMGDTIFTPAYEVLKKRGVKFKFFHRLRDVELSDDRTRVDKLTLGLQAHTIDPDSRHPLPPGEYDPLVPHQVRSLDLGQEIQLMTWPSRPKTEWLEQPQIPSDSDPEEFENPDSDRPDVDTITLSHGEHFHKVVLAIPIGALRDVCPQLQQHNARVKQMIEKVETVRTAAYQIWLRKDLAAMGWKDEAPVLGNFVDPLNTWCDMSHLLPAEGLQEEGEALNIAYFCGTMPDAIPAEEAKKYVQEQAAILMDQMAKHFLPGARNTAGSAFDVSLRVSDYSRANLNSSDRYTLSLAGTTKYRLRVDETGVSNLYFAGDWTRNNFNVGAAEPTVMSGMQASNAISGYPLLKDIVRNSGP
jgi:uncharacterized protein with NAD-binding domain and iron-sulfur cluster